MSFSRDELAEILADVFSDVEGTYYNDMRPGLSGDEIDLKEVTLDGRYDFLEVAQKIIDLIPGDLTGKME